jgi:hypothetical protein
MIFNLKVISLFLAVRTKIFLLAKGNTVSCCEFKTAGGDSCRFFIESIAKNLNDDFGNQLRADVPFLNQNTTKKLPRYGSS